MKIEYFKKNWHFIFLSISAFLTRFFFLAYPSETVFDEVHFGKFASYYFNHQYYFDIHPPLGKMLIAGFTKIFGLHPEATFSNIGEGVSSGEIFLLRFLPALTGALLVILIYKLVLKIGLSKKAAFLAGFLTLFSSTLSVQSRLVLVDIFLLFFGFLSLYFFFDWEKKKKLYVLLIASFFAALSFSIKWTGLTFFGLIFLFNFLKIFKTKKYKDTAFKLILLSLVFVITYFAVFFVHFKILYKSGTGDAFMSSSFQKSLEGNNLEDNVKAAGSFEKFIELNEAMYRYNSTLKADHPFASKWYQWILGKGSIWYWSKSTNSKTANIYLIANPLIWWAVIAGVITSLILFSRKTFRKKVPLEIYIFTTGFFVNIIPFLKINRVTFLYHYLPSLIFGILVLSALYKTVFKNKFSSHYLISFLVLVFLVFLLLLPLIYGFPLENNILQKIYSPIIDFL